MKIQVFTIPAFDGDEATKRLNEFLGSHRIADVQREFISNGLNSHWSICVTAAQGREKSDSGRKTRIDYRDVLPERDFAVFAQLRTLRKEISEQEGVPPYALFTNEQLAEMVRRKVANDSGLQEIDGIGPTRIKKYGERFVSALRNAMTSDTMDGHEESAN